MTATLIRVGPSLVAPEGGVFAPFPGWTALGADDAAALNGALQSSSSARPGDVLAAPRGTGAFLILSGWAALQRTSASGVRQIIGFFLPGDLVGLDTATAPMADGEVVALTSMRLRRLTLDGRDALARVHGLVRAIAAQNLQHQGRLQDQILRLGAMGAAERTAHLLAELDERLQRGAGSTRPQPFPIRQELIAQTLGLSLVHVNRTLKHLKALSLAWFERGCLVVPDRGALVGWPPKGRAA